MSVAGGAGAGEGDGVCAVAMQNVEIKQPRAISSFAGCCILVKSKNSKIKTSNENSFRLLSPGRRRLNESYGLQDAYSQKAEVVFPWRMARSQEVREVMVVVLKTGTERGGNGKPFAKVHGVVALLLIASSAKATVMGPIILHHV